MCCNVVCVTPYTSHKFSVSNFIGEETIRAKLSLPYPGRKENAMQEQHTPLYGTKTRQHWLCYYTFFLLQYIYADFPCKSLTHLLFRKLWVSLSHLLLLWMWVIMKYWWCLVALTSSPSSQGMYVVKHKNVWEIMKATHYLATAQARVSTCSQCTDFGLFLSLFMAFTLLSLHRNRNNIVQRNTWDSWT